MIDLFIVLGDVYDFPDNPNVFRYGKVIFQVDVWLVKFSHGYAKLFKLSGIFLLKQK